MKKSKRSKDEYINIFKNLYGEKYDYKETVFNSVSDKIKVLCKKHGYFEKRLNNHLRGIGCEKCSKDDEKLTREEFINKSKDINGEKYDYSLVEYKNHMKKVKIICKKHGVFEQTPNNHICKKQGCPHCVINKKITTEIFIKRANLVHKNKYNYSLVKYNNIKSKLKIICNEHGMFEQVAYNHLNGSGCLKCKRIIVDQKDLIKKSKIIHKNKYDYSLVDYKTTAKKIKIICKKHGMFKQYPLHHIQGCGCPICKESKGEKFIVEYLNNKKINFLRNKSFENLKYKKSLRFDFFIKNYNMCIEYDGEQHFRPIEYFGGEKTYLESKKRDNIKNKYCEYNKIKLLRISYKQDIAVELDKIFNI